MKKILIANRGEIANRIIKTCKKLGIKTVAVYSDADREALHTLNADEAYYIGPNILAESYLNGEKIIKVALEASADGIHPGYGFLSENEDFANQVEKAGLIFIGPTPESIRTMGNKLAAKEAVKAFNIPMVPGTDGLVADKKVAREAAKKVGYPILIKAAAGGGGKGMRVVNDDSEFDEAYDFAVSEAITAFKDGSVMIEKYVLKPRHIEIQVIADNYGNVCHLFERECSIQRRHQKVVEEAPSSVVTEEMRTAMGTTAVNVARACGYRGVGTVEFIVDADLNFYFLEMNTRLQVEHPVTEFITGLDLVEEQIKIAEGKGLGFCQDDLEIRGHAIELRIYAEDSFANFLPSTGTLTKYSEPKGEYFRVDGGYQQGDEVSVFFDPLISKLIVWDVTRMKAIQRMKEAIDQYDINGMETTLPFGRFVMNHEAFVSGNFDTSFVTQYFNEDSRIQIEMAEAEIAARVACALSQQNHRPKQKHIDRQSSWRLV
ncbi:MAG: acetyl-CoA carboxylase biotin carboxylase subunit [Saprospiraceae bacterium]|nr:acetyl-CoA carboxylase biotin carboxylase subunit [Saprospiraceae bacterium]